MENKKTTIAGYVVLAAAVLTVVGTYLAGGDIGKAIETSLLPALGAIGLIAAKDGGH